MNVKHCDLKKINKTAFNQATFKKYRIDTCSYADRFFQITSGLNGVINLLKNFVEPLSSFHTGFRNEIHFYVMHIFEIGMRKKKYHPLDDEIKVNNGDDVILMLMMNAQ